MAEVDLENEKTYDSVFWTALVKMTDFVIPLVNEVFGEHFTSKAKVVLKPSKQVTEEFDGSFERGEVDALAEIIEDGNVEVRKNYHFEVESRPNGAIAVRLAEYGTAAAYASVTQTAEGAEVTIPHSAVIFLRTNKSVPDRYVIRIVYPGGTVSYDVPIIKMKDYTVEEIIEKRLLLLLPFMAFLFEDALAEMEENEDSFEVLKNALDETDRRLEELKAHKEINEVTKQHLIDWVKRVFDKISVKYERVREGVDHIMGGYIIKTRTDEILEEGISQGVSQGVNQGVEQGRDERGKEVAKRMYEDGISVSKVAQYVGEEEEVVKKWLEKEETKV